MAKKSKGGKKAVPSLKAAFKKSLDAAKKLRGKVAEKSDLDATIKGLTDLQAKAAKGCGAQTWARKFTLVSTSTKKR
jgi:hypothetical protein